MALRTATALKAKIESFGLGITVNHRRPAPQGSGAPAALPYVVVHDRIASTPDPISTAGNRTAPLRVVREECQIDVWQAEYGTPDGTTGARSRVENPQLAEFIAANLDGARLVGSTGRAYRVKLLNGPFEMPEPQEANLIHDVILVAVTKRMAAS